MKIMWKSSLPRIAFDQGFKRIKVSGDSVERDRTKLEKSRITFTFCISFDTNDIPKNVIELLGPEW